MINDYSNSTIVSNDTFNCFKYFKIGTKQIIWNGNETFYQKYTSQNLVNSNIATGRKNSVLVAYQTPIDNYFRSFVDVNFNVTVCSTLWVVPYNSTAYGCDLAKTAMYYCSVRNQTCGFFLNKKTYTDKILNGVPTANCSELGSFPLFFDGKP